MRTTTVKKVLALGTAFLIGIAAALPIFLALAQQQAGATYTGAHDDGGSVSLVVSDDGLAVQSFEAHDIPGDPLFCPDDVIDVSLSNIPIATSSLFLSDFISSAQVDGVAVTVSGDFDIPGFVTGSIMTESSEGYCFSVFNDVSYAASVDAATLPCPMPGDVNNDGGRNSIDATLLLQLDAGLITSLPCES